MDMKEVIYAAFSDQKELLYLLDLASLALTNNELIFRVCVAEDYPGADVTPLPRLSNLQAKISALLQLAETSDQVSFRSTLRIEALPPDEDKMTPKRRQEIALLKAQLGMDPKWNPKTKSTP
jgi:hypothetical protein